MKKFCIIMLFVAGLLSCSDENQQTNEFDYEKFLNEKAAWESLNIDHYRFIGEIVSPSAAPRGRITVTVFPDKEPEVVIKDQIVSEPYPFYHTRGKTISGIYEWYERYINWENFEVFDISIRYNSQYHYPEQIVKYLKRPETGGEAAGDGSKFYIYEFEDLRGQ